MIRYYLLEETKVLRHMRFWKVHNSIQSCEDEGKKVENLIKQGFLRRILCFQ